MYNSFMHAIAYVPKRFVFRSFFKLTITLTNRRLVGQKLFQKTCQKALLLEIFMNYLQKNVQNKKCLKLKLCFDEKVNAKNWQKNVNKTFWATFT